MMTQDRMILRSDLFDAIERGVSRISHLYDDLAPQGHGATAIDAELADLVATGHLVRANERTGLDHARAHYGFKLNGFGHVVGGQS